MSEVKISKQKLDQLLRDQEKLNALESGGVDNWEWYGESLKEYNQRYYYKELISDLASELSSDPDHFEYEFPAGREAGINIWLTESATEFLEAQVLKIIQEYKEFDND